MSYQLLFVCLGNICRSPAAENLMNDLIIKRGLSGKITCDSAGTASYHIGSPPDQRMVAAALQRGIMMKGQARQFSSSDFAQFDLILAMDRDNYQGILSLDRNQEYGHKVKRMADFCSRHKLREVPDPYFGGLDGFNQVLDLLQDACEGLLDYIQSSQQVLG